MTMTIRKSSEEAEEEEEEEDSLMILMALKIMKFFSRPWIGDKFDDQPLAAT